MANRIDFVAVARDSGGLSSAPKSVGLPVNEPPIIDSVAFLDPTTRQPVTQVQPGGKVLVAIAARDPEGEALAYGLAASAGTIAATPAPNEFLFTAP